MPVVTLSTDIGQSDYVVGAIKGQLLQAVPSVSLIDITHQLVSNNYLHAAYVCTNAFPFYPAEPPTDAAIIGIVDQVQLGAKTIFNTSK